MAEAEDGRGRGWQRQEMAEAEDGRGRGGRGRGWQRQRMDCRQANNMRKEEILPDRILHTVSGTAGVDYVV
jgi:hypothetical protein